MKITRFEDIKAWQIERDLCRLVYDAVKKERFSKDYGKYLKQTTRNQERRTKNEEQETKHKAGGTKER